MGAIKEMYFLSVQPDLPYFLWQVKLLISNLKKFQVKADKIHILFCHNKNKQPNQEILLWSENQEEASVFFYPDLRVYKTYKSSIRPHLLYQHFKKHSFLEKKTIFFHDSDILFTSLSDFNELLVDHNWYLSNTDPYTGIEYLTNTLGPVGIQRVCKLAEVNYDDLLKVPCFGGAQYIIKSANHQFWKQHEDLCERLFKFLILLNRKAKANIQAWCADMWSLQLLMLKQGIPFKIDERMDFSWPFDNYDDLKNIFHYSGADTSATLFQKESFSQYDPFFESFDYIDMRTACRLIVEHINQIKQRELENINCNSTLYFFRDKHDSAFDEYRSYTLKNFNPANECIGVASLENLEEILSSDLQNFKKKGIKHVIISRCNLVFDVRELNCMLINDTLSNDAVFALKSDTYYVDRLSSRLFGKFLSYDFFEVNKGKYFKKDEKEIIYVINLEKYYSDSPMEIREVLFKDYFQLKGVS